MPYLEGNKESGFTLVEIIASLVLAGIIAGVSAMCIAYFANGFIMVKKNAAMAQKAQPAMLRIKREFMELTNIIGNNDSSAKPYTYLIYENIYGRHSIAIDNTEIKMVFDIDILNPPTLPTDGDVLIDNVESFILNYYKDYLAEPKIPWVSGTDDMDLLTIIRVDLKLSGFADTFYAIVFPRNISR